MEPHSRIKTFYSRRDKSCTWFLSGTTLRELEATVAETTQYLITTALFIFKTGGSGQIQALAIDSTGRVLNEMQHHR